MRAMRPCSTLSGRDIESSFGRLSVLSIETLTHLPGLAIQQSNFRKSPLLLCFSTLPKNVSSPRISTNNPTEHLGSRC